MVKHLFTMFLLVSFTYANPYDSFYWGFKDGKSTKIKYSDIVFQVDSSNLIDSAKKLHFATIELYKDKINSKKELTFIESFPSSFKVFLEVFHPKGFDQLYDGHIHMYIFSRLSKKYPKKVGRVIVSLSKDACLDTDAPNYLQKELKSFKKDYPKLFRESYENLNKNEKTNLNLFLDASLLVSYEGKGLCN